MDRLGTAIRSACLPISIAAGSAWIRRAPSSALVRGSVPTASTTNSTLWQRRSCAPDTDHNHQKQKAATGGGNEARHVVYANEQLGGAGRCSGYQHFGQGRRRRRYRRGNRAERHGCAL